LPGGLGFEPRLAESESEKLRRHNPPQALCRHQISQLSSLWCRPNPTCTVAAKIFGADMVPPWREEEHSMQAKVTKRVVDGVEPREATYLVRDTEVKGFVLVVTPAGARSYAVDYRAGSGRGSPKGRLMIGKHGSPRTPETACVEAKRLRCAATTRHKRYVGTKSRSSQHLASSPLAMASSIVSPSRSSRPKATVANRSFALRNRCTAGLPNAPSAKG